MSLTLDTSQFARFMRERQKITKESSAKLLNRAGRNVAFRAIKYTPKAAAGKIKRDLNKRVVWTGAKARRSRKSGRMRKIKPTKLFYLVAQKYAREHGWKRDKLTRFSKKRLSSRGYISVGWFKVAKDFGAKVKRFSNKSLVAKSLGTQATPSKLAAYLENAARGAPKIGRIALQQAINEVGREMHRWAKEEYRKPKGAKKDTSAPASINAQINSILGK